MPDERGIETGRVRLCGLSNPGSIGEPIIRGQKGHGSFLIGFVCLRAGLMERANHMARLEGIRDRLEAIGQAHLLTFHDGLSPDEQNHLLNQIEAIDLERVPEWIDRYVASRPTFELPARLKPPLWYPKNAADPARPYDAERFRRIGAELVSAGKVAVFCVAGGQGTRLGWAGPKGTFPATPVLGKPLFQVFAESIRAANRKYATRIPLYVMTSPLNHEPTRAFFGKHGFFGLDAADVIFFQQGVMPSFDKETGRMLLAWRGGVAVNPDGHGGSLKALYTSGAVRDMTERGIEHISYVQIDNPLVKVIDPLFVGLHAAAEDSSAEMSSKMVVKAGPTERVGNFCRADGKTIVIEYSDMPEKLAQSREPSGDLTFPAGSIAIHCIGVEFVKRLNAQGAGESAGFALPWHRAEKLVGYVDLQTGLEVQPDKPNAIKLESFVFDALSHCRASIVLETDRSEEFAPIKNPTGLDSAESARGIQTERNARWLASQGVQIPRDARGRVEAVIEISPLTALEAEDLAGRSDLPDRIEPGEEFTI